MDANQSCGRRHSILAHLWHQSEQLSGMQALHCLSLSASPRTGRPLAQVHSSIAPNAASGESKSKQGRRRAWEPSRTHDPIGPLALAQTPIISRLSHARAGRTWHSHSRSGPVLEQRLGLD
ncbi:hypothetical protein AcV7_002218 [Taiwanofungus camphoratus]|nr:hypothetical protein AcV7_002218 [Antrodia cinnamomea]